MEKQEIIKKITNFGFKIIVLVLLGLSIHFTKNSTKNDTKPPSDFYNNDVDENFNIHTFIQCSLLRSLNSAYQQAETENKKLIICERSIAIVV